MARITDIEDAVSALEYLRQWRQRKVEVRSEEHFDYLFGMVTDELAMLNDERYRFRDR